jgi:hypothetical protein
LWADGHTGTIITVPSSIIRTSAGQTYRQNRFWLSEMNSRCKGEKTVKFIWMKSFDLETTLRGANKTRGPAKFFYRYQ